MMLTVLSSKVVVLVVLFVMTCGLGLIPVRLMTYIQRRAATSFLQSDLSGQHSLTVYKRVLSFLSCFAAGVFLATCFLDLLPGVRKHLITVLFEMNIRTGFPLAEFIMSLGLFLILIVEQIVLLTKERKHTESHSHHKHSVDVTKPLLDDSSVAATTSTRTEQTLAHRGEADSLCSSQSLDHIVDNDLTISGISDEPFHEHSHRDDAMPPFLPNREEDHHTHFNYNNHHHHHDHDHDLNFQSHSPLRALMLVIALSLHSIFEGLTVGLQSETGQVLGIFAALVLHKSILSFSIGMNLVQSRLSAKSCIKSVVFYSLMAPVGVAIGILITDLWDSNSSNLVDGILQGLACGTFLYMTFFEVLPAEFNSPNDRMLKLLLLLLGYGTVTGILFLDDDIKAPFCKIN